MYIIDNVNKTHNAILDKVVLGGKYTIRKG
jgi:hypothetical protein